MVVFALADLLVCTELSGSHVIIYLFPLDILSYLESCSSGRGMGGRMGPMLNRPNFPFGRSARGQFHEPVGPYGI